MTDLKPEIITDLPDASPSDPLEALSWLGETVEEIAEGLRARGIKGQPCDPEYCVLAGYLRLWWPDMNVGVQFVYGNGYDEGFSPTLLEFRRGFDRGAFPDLIEP